VSRSGPGTPGPAGADAPRPGSAGSGPPSPGPDATLALAERALAHARGEAQVSVVHERSLLLRFAHSRPTQATAIDELAVEISCVRDGRLASAAAAGTSDEALRDAAARAAGAAVAAARAGAGSYPGLPEPPREPRSPHDDWDPDGWDPETAELDPAAGGEALGAAFDVAAGAALEAFGVWSAGAVRTAIATTTGVVALDSVTDAFAKVICRDASGRSGYASAAGVRAADLDMAALARRAAGKVYPREEPAELPAGEYDVVLDAEAVAPLLEFFGALALNGLAVAEGRSALSGRAGARVAAATINLSDSPRFPRTLPRAFDAEGVPKLPLPLIEDGVAQRVVHDTHSAAIAGHGAHSTGHALVPGGAAEGPAPTNLVLVGGGATDVHELAAPIERGIYVTRLWYVNPVDPKHTLLTGMTRDGTFLIEDGRIARPLRDVRFTDSVLRLLDCTEELTAQPRLVSEGEFYGRRFASGVVCPALRTRGLRVTGATTG
jgi:predicted Zn-dependent protease